MTVNTEQAAATRLSPFFRVMDDPAGGRYCSNGIRACGNFINSTPVVKMTLMDLYRSSSAKFFTDPTQFRKNP